MPLPGDFFVTRTPGVWAGIIRWATSSTVNHAGVYVGAVVGYKRPQVIEARPGGAGYRDASAYADAVWSSGALSALDTPTVVQRRDIVTAARQALGTPYGVLDIVAIALAQHRTGALVKAAVALQHQPWWVRRIMSMRTLICSQLVDECYTAAGLHLFPDGRLPGLVSPGDLYGLLAANEVMS